MTEGIAVDAEGPVARVTLARSDAHNALDPDMVAGIEDALAAAEESGGVRCVVLDADGGSFCVGADVEFIRERSTAEIRSFLSDATDAFRAIETSPVPVVSAVDGAALGGGMELALATDIVVAGDSAEFGLPEATLGLLPAGGGTQRLPRIVGRKVASELLFTGTFVDADRAGDLGIVNRVTDGDPLPEALTVAESITRSAPQSVSACKRLVVEGRGMPMDEALAAEQEAVYDLLGSRDSTEGISAFLEGRRPEFSGD